MTAAVVDLAKHVVYRAFAADGTLLYVGCTAHPQQRLSAHREAPWFPLAVRFEYVEYPNYCQGRVAEAQAIRAEHPVCNIVGRDIPYAAAIHSRDEYLAAHLPAAAPDPAAARAAHYARMALASSRARRSA